MSDFDKEAEREKLREKYGEEEDEKRKATEQMSELLLKGATMTNAHCTDCGDPIFRYDGQEFCPTCQKPVAREAPDGEADDGDHIEVADPSDDATVQFGGEAADEQGAAAAQDTTDEAPENAAPEANAPDMASDAAGHPPAAEGDATQEVPSADPDRTPGANTGGRAADTHSGDAGRRAADTHSGAAGRRAADTHSGAAGGRREATPETPLDSPSEPTPPRRQNDADNSVTAELSAAESLLAQTVHRFAQRAADTDDPRTAREQLKAAREAAETLDAVRF